MHMSVEEAFSLQTKKPHTRKRLPAGFEPTVQVHKRLIDRPLHYESVGPDTDKQVSSDSIAAWSGPELGMFINSDDNIRSICTQITTHNEATIHFSGIACDLVLWR